MRSLPKRIGVKRLVGEDHHIAQRFEMAHGGVDIDGFDGIAGDEIDAVEILGELQELAVVGMVAGAAAAFHVGAIGRAAHGAEQHVRPADLRIVFRIAGMEGELRGRRFHQLLDHRGIKAHALAGNIGTGLLQQVAGFRQSEVHADFGQHFQRGAVDGFNFVGGDDRHRRKSPRRLCGGAIAEWRPSRQRRRPGGLRHRAGRGVRFPDSRVRWRPRSLCFSFFAIGFEGWIGGDLLHQPVLEALDLRFHAVFAVAGELPLVAVRNQKRKGLHQPARS